MFSVWMVLLYYVLYAALGAFEGGSVIVTTSQTANGTALILSYLVLGYSALPKEDLRRPLKHGLTVN